MNWTLTINVTPITVNVTGLGPLSELAAALSKTPTCTTNLAQQEAEIAANDQLIENKLAEIEARANEPATPPAKRTRKRVDDPKQVEAVTGRRVEGLTESTPVTAEGKVIENHPINTLAQDQVDLTPEQGEAVQKAVDQEIFNKPEVITTTVQPEPIEAVSALVDEANPESFNWTLDQLKATFVPKIDDEALRAERNAHAKSVLSGFGAQTLSVLDAEHYPAFAAAMTDWYKAKGFELQLPEGAE
jgi:flagellum-specific peptidoglycan hydrolase FlgJ